ncbi:hypothetical protein IscW_ISCW014901, partial [Ixodes scapularis]
ARASFPARETRNRQKRTRSPTKHKRRLSRPTPELSGAASFPERRQPASRQEANKRRRAHTTPPHRTAKLLSRRPAYRYLRHHTYVRQSNPSARFPGKIRYPPR